MPGALLDPTQDYSNLHTTNLWISVFGESSSWLKTNGWFFRPENKPKRHTARHSSFRGELQERMKPSWSHFSSICIPGACTFMPSVLYFRLWPEFFTGASAESSLWGERGRKTLKIFFLSFDSVASIFPLLALLPCLFSNPSSHKTARGFSFVLLQQGHDTHVCADLPDSPLAYCSLEENKQGS